MRTEKQKRNRLIWAKSKDWTYEDWARVIFSDEAKFQVCVGDERKRVIRSQREAFHNDCLKLTVKFAKGVMVRGCVSAYGTGCLELINGTVNAEMYKTILENNLLPSIELFNAKDPTNTSFIFQQVGAAVHTAKSVKQWFADQGMRVLSWPSSSPDLNIIENVWHYMKKHFREHPQRNLPDLRVKIQELWNGIPPHVTDKLIRSMPTRIRAVIKAKGDVTAY